MESRSASLSLIGEARHEAIYLPTARPSRRNVGELVRARSGSISYLFSLLQVVALG